MRHTRTVAAHVDVHQRIPDAVFLVAIGPDHLALLAQRRFRRRSGLQVPVSSTLKCGSVSSGSTLSTRPSAPTLAPQAYWPMGCWVQMTRRPPLACGHSKLGRPNWACTSASGVPGATWASWRRPTGPAGRPPPGRCGLFCNEVSYFAPLEGGRAPLGPEQFYRISYNRRALSRHPFRMMPNRAGGGGGQAKSQVPPASAQAAVRKRIRQSGPRFFSPTTSGRLGPVACPKRS